MSKTFTGQQYLGIYLLSSYLNHTSNYIPLISQAITISTFLMAFHLQITKDANKAMATLSKALSIYIYLNFVLILIYPNGIWINYNDYLHDNYGLYMIGGNHNQMGATLLCATVASSVCSLLEKKGRANMIGVMLASLISLYVVRSMTSLVGISIFFVFTLMSSKHIHLLFFKLFIGFYFIFQLLLVFLLSDISSFSLFYNFILNVLQKDLTFSNRTVIWEASVLKIAQSPIWGYGFQTPEWYRENIIGVNSHNFVYGILMKGGFVLLICVIGLLFIIWKKEYSNRTQVSLITHFGFWVLLFMMTMELYNFFVITCMMALIYYSSYYRNPNKRYGLM